MVNYIFLKHLAIEFLWLDFPCIILLKKAMVTQILHSNIPRLSSNTGQKKFSPNFEGVNQI